MTVFKPPRGKSYRYDFYFRKQRYTGNTHQVTEPDAQLMERELQLRLRHEAGGIAQFFPGETPRIQDWAETFIAFKKAHIERPDHVMHVTRVLLRFFGAPTKGATRTEETPFHDLRLGDLIADPDWVLKFEDWMRRRPIGNQSKNHYRGIMRRMYALALQPAYRKTTGIAMNPFAGLPSDPTSERTVTLGADQVNAWLGAASYHVRLAIAIAALAPKLRLRNVLDLRWDEHFEPDPRGTKFNPRVAHYITVRRHKTATKTRRPLVSPINQQLLRILKDAWRRDPRQPHVVTYRGKPVHSIRGGVKAAAEDADLPYGRDTEDGATFHTLRHTAATLLSNVEVDPLKLRDALGHTDLATTMKYRHMKPTHERPSLERLSRTLPIEKIVMVARRRAQRRKPGALEKVLGPAKRKAQKPKTIARPRVRSKRRRSRH